ncbi:bifunctional transcriptional regulator/glucokinase [Pandoraea sp. SD6-2]|uniref:bifunctional transcriptional regulator/glucokinase n=1 Tax=Pandoraea sp. SD6-2 TaxID=1286093 RepID=UPI000568FC86|nr:bifunctional transcriptional regulator/glucokinase [Pandoraea sp. SD6-2]
MSSGVRNNSPHMSGPRLLADIGGTNARFALEIAPGDLVEIRDYACDDYPGVPEVIRAYLDEADHAEPVLHAAIAIANPIEGDEIRMTNRDWHFSIEATRRVLGFETLLVVNDFTALAMALPYLSDTQKRQVGGGEPQPNGVIGLLGPGTGVGVSGLIPAGDRWIALGSEGGHTTFAPADEREIDVLRYAWQHFPHVSFERLVAGPGMALVYQALARREGREGREVEPLETPAIVKLAQGGDALARETVDCFCAMLGTLAGNVAVTLGAVGGVYLGGGVIPKLGKLFENSPFRQRFEAKGRFEGYLKKIPTYVITADHPAFLGTSAMLAEQLGTHAAGAGGLIDRLHRLRDRLSPAEQRVAELTLRQPRALLAEPVSEIARLARVSQPTVIRFCRKLGCQGLSDFKLKLASALTGTLPVRHGQVHVGDSAAEFSAKVLDNTVSSILQMREHLDARTVEAAVTLLDGAHRIEFYGLGNSGVIAQDAHYKFFRFGMPTIAYGDPYLLQASAGLLGDGDVVVAISASGRSADLNRAVDIAVARGAKVIALTARNSPLARKATLVLPNDHVETMGAHVTMIARILHLAAIDVLAVGVAIRRAGPGAETAGEGALDWLRHGSAQDSDTPAVA